MTGQTSPVDVGVIGVGSMGQNHARVYSELSNATLVGVYDSDETIAQSVATRYDTSVYDPEQLLDRIDAVSIAVPTQYHYEFARDCLEAGVATLIEKPIVEKPSNGRRLRRIVDQTSVPLLVGHVERFNPAVQTLATLCDDLTIKAITANRLGPPPDRKITDSAVLDLMIHDIDIVRSLVGRDPIAVHSTGVEDRRHATALLEFESDVMATLTASRMTERKVRRLEITAKECYVELDYIDQSIEIHRHSVPAFVENDRGVQFRHESLVERPHVPNHEPLRNELETFLDVTRGIIRPPVTLDDGLAALSIARKIDHQCTKPIESAEAMND